MNSSSERILGQYPLSIATSLAIEGIMGIHPDYPIGKHSLSDFDTVWVNLKTLYRNFYNAHDKEFVGSIPISDQVLYFSQEMDAIKKVINSESENRTKVRFYLPNYDKVSRRYRHALMRVDHTPKQLAYAKAMVSVIEGILEQRKDEVKLVSDVILDAIGGKALMLTHYPLDLTTRAFGTVALLESHTGIVKTKEMWYTKYYNGKDMVGMPFTAALLSIFGDNDMFRPMPIQYRRNLLELSEKYHWNFLTTKDKILYGLSTLKDKMLAEQLRLWINS